MMQNITKTAMAAGLLLALCSGTAQADWEETKARVLAYHDQFTETPLTFDGVSELSTTSFGRTQGCTITYKYEGQGRDLGLVISKPHANSGIQTCQMLSAQTQRIVGQGISLTGQEVRQLFNFLDFDESVPERIKETDEMETYRTVAVDSDAGEQGTQPTGDLGYEMDFSKPEGRFIALRTFGEVHEKDEDMSMDAEMKGGTEFGMLASGQPYITMTFLGDEGRMRGNGQSVRFKNSLRMTFSNVAPLDGSADGVVAEARPVSLETGGGNGASEDQRSGHPLDAFGLKSMDDVIEAARDLAAETQNAELP